MVSDKIRSARVALERLNTEGSAMMPAKVTSIIEMVRDCEAQVREMEANLIVPELEVEMVVYLETSAHEAA